MSRYPSLHAWINYASPGGLTLSVLALSLLAGCADAISATPSSSDFTGEDVPPGLGGGGGTGTGTDPSGLPCDVAAVLTNGCTDCHSSPPVPPATRSLVTYADLAKMSSIDPSMTMAQRCVVRMENASSPMPPGSGVSAPAADIAVLQAWIDAGLPEGSCDPGGGSTGAGGAASGDPFDGPAQCTSGETWMKGPEGDKLMYPGRACISCHESKGDGPIFSIAGTVYPGPHEPDDCLSTGVDGAVIEITDKHGNVMEVPVNANGNFAIKTGAFAYPYTARVLHEGKERVMQHEQTSGDCNACHTQDGGSGAPGRVLLP